MIPATGIPYVVGQWVRGERFYGRDHLITEILDGEGRINGGRIIQIIG